MKRIGWLAFVLMTFMGGLSAEECPCGPECACEMGADCDCESKCASWWDKPFFCSMQCPEPVCGEWLPGDPQPMRPFLADPRQVNYSAGWRFDDQRLVKNVIPVSYGAAIPIYRWSNVWPWCGYLQLELEGAVWAVFDPLHESSPLMNADYYIAVPLTYVLDDWQFRLRGFHISSHIGDEYLLNHPYFKRLNPSAEYLDFFISHNMTEEIRVYAGLGWVVASDESFPMKKFYAEAGGEVHMYGLGFWDECAKIYGDPYFAVYMRYRGEHTNHVDMTYALGYEFGKTCGREPLLRLFMSYHDGYSVEGQFSRFPTNYFALQVTYGY